MPRQWQALEQEGGVADKSQDRLTSTPMTLAVVTSSLTMLRDRKAASLLFVLFWSRYASLSLGNHPSSFQRARMQKPKEYCLKNYFISAKLQFSHPEFRELNSHLQTFQMLYLERNPYFQLQKIFQEFIGHTTSTDHILYLNTLIY